MDEISVIPNGIKVTTITTARSQAQELGLFDPNDKVNFYTMDEEELEHFKQAQEEMKKQESQRSG